MPITNLGSDLHHMVDFQYLNKDSVIVDAGASDGRFIEAIFRFFGKGDTLEARPIPNIYALEPNKRNFKILMDKYGEMGIHINGMALIHEGYSGNSAVFTEYQGPDGKYFQWGNVTGIHRMEITKRRKTENIKCLKYAVPIIKLSKILEKFHVIDYLKMDIEGAEDLIVRGMELVANRINQISFEYHLDNTDIVVEALKSYGYQTIVKGKEVYGTRLQSSTVS